MIVRLTLPGMALMAALVAGPPPALSASSAVTIGGPLELVASDGTTVSEATYRGKWLLVYFGYTYCPDTCPTALNEIAAALEALGPDAAGIQALFITVDPERDTPEVMGSYVKAFDPRIAGLTGSQEQIDAVTHAYGSYGWPHRAAEGDKDYAVDHSSYIYLMDPQGKFVRGFDSDTTGARIAEAVRKAMGLSS